MTRCNQTPETVYQCQVEHCVVLVSLSAADEAALRRFSRNDGLCSPIDLRPPFLPAVKTILQGLKIIGIVSGAEEWRGKPLAGLVGQRNVLLMDTGG